MGIHRKTFDLIEKAKRILADAHPMTLRQIFYQLVSSRDLENSDPAIKKLGRDLVTARKEKIIPWEWMEDRLRRPRHVSMWSGLSDFAETCRRSYRLNVWPSQPHYFEAWLEKDALSGIFEDVLDPYGVTLNVGRGYDGWSSIFGAAQRFKKREAVTILYFGDFDPCGEDMARSLKERLGELGSQPEIIKCALTHADIKRYNLPPNPTKKKDKRAAAFIAKYGDISVELDALPVDILRARLKTEIERRMDLKALAKVKHRQERDRKELMKKLRRR